MYFGHRASWKSGLNPQTDKMLTVNPRRKGRPQARNTRNRNMGGHLKLNYAHDATRAYLSGRMPVWCSIQAKYSVRAAYSTSARWGLLGEGADISRQSKSTPVSVAL